MPGIPMEVIEYKLGIDPSFKSIKQKERRYTIERRETIKQEANKLIQAGFIMTVDYPSWLVNPDLVEKSDDSRCMCFDYTSLNKACLEDEYLCLISVKLLIPQHRVNYYHFWMPIRGLESV
jgi:hypothetical protein